MGQKRELWAADGAERECHADGEGSWGMNGDEVAVGLLEKRNRELGNLLLAERAPHYVAILATMLEMRRDYEIEPLHEELYGRVAQLSEAGAYAVELFNQDIRQLLQWELIGERIEKERLRGYKDSRRHKFRYRLIDETIAFLLWLEGRRRDDLTPAESDTRDLLSELIQMLRETSRSLNRCSAAEIDYETARSIFYRLARMSELTESVSRTLGELNVRLLSFATGRYDVALAQTILRELDHFLRSFLNRIHTLRHEIVPEVERLLQRRYATRWQAAFDKLLEESQATANLMRTRLLPPLPTLQSIAGFYGSDGRLEKLTLRVNEAGLLVWRKLYTHLRELERRNHRLEDVRSRIAEIAALAPEVVPREFMQRLLAAAHIVGNMDYWDEREKALPPQPRWEKRRLRSEQQLWLGEKREAGGAPVQSLEEERLQQLAEWLKLRGLLGAGAEGCMVSEGKYGEFEDFRRLIELSRSGLLGRGRRLGRLGLALRPGGPRTVVEHEQQSLEFFDMRLHESGRERSE